ncbi:hypothetical protein [Bartonella sp. DGB2]
MTSCVVWSSIRAGTTFIGACGINCLAAFSAALRELNKSGCGYTID